MKYEVGTKLKIVKFPNKRFIGDIGVVMEKEKPNSPYCCCAKFNKLGMCAMYDCEVRPLFTMQKDGQMLLFEVD